MKRLGRAASTAMLLGFLVRLMLVAARAELLPLDALRVEALVLRGEVVPILALATGENDLVSGHGASSCVLRAAGCGLRDRRITLASRSPHPASYHFRIFVTTPAPTVRPPSRIA